jgi:hypothetical protein
MVLWRESTKAYPEARGSHETLVPQVREPKDYWRTMWELQNGSVMSARGLVELNFDSFGVGPGAEMVDFCGFQGLRNEICHKNPQAPPHTP